jgi:hypothetical protein
MFGRFKTMGRIKNWEKTRWDTGNRFKNIYGKKGSKEVVWLDNWMKGNWAIVSGEELPSKGHSVTYKEKGTIINVRTKKDALKEMMRYMMEN